MSAETCKAIHSTSGQACKTSPTFKYSETSPLNLGINWRSYGGGDGLVGGATAGRFVLSRHCDEVTLLGEQAKVATLDDTSP